MKYTTPNAAYEAAFILQVRYNAALKTAEFFAREYSKARLWLGADERRQMFNHVQELDAAALSGRNAWHAARAEAGLDA